MSLPSKMWTLFYRSAISLRSNCKGSCDSKFTNCLFRSPSHTPRANTFSTVNSNQISRNCGNVFKGQNIICCGRSQLIKPWSYNSRFNINSYQIQQRCFRTSSKINALPPIVVVVLGRVAKFGAVVFGRTVRRWWQKLPPEERAVYARKVSRNRYIISGLLGALAFGAFVYYDQRIQETPYTNRRRFIAFNNAQIVELAKIELETLLQLNEKSIIPANKGSAVYRKIVGVAQQLLTGNQDIAQIHEIDWTVTVVNDDSQMNAFVLPCGSIFVYSGLLKICDSNDQLGIILAHEMAHAVMGHGAEKASLLHFVDLMLIIPLAALWALLPTDFTAAIAHWISQQLTNVMMDLPHSRLIEEEADQVGLILAAKACFDIREAPVVWAKFRIMENDQLSLEWLSTHPSHERRQAQLEEMLPNAITVREKCQCPRLPLLDPRIKIEGYKRILQVKDAERKANLLVPVKIEDNRVRSL